MEILFNNSTVAGAGNIVQLLQILCPTWTYELGSYTEWFRSYARLDPELKACRTNAIFDVFYRLEHDDVGGAGLAGAPIVLPEYMEHQSEDAAAK